MLRFDSNSLGECGGGQTLHAQLADYSLRLPDQGDGRHFHAVDDELHVMVTERAAADGSPRLIVGRYASSSAGGFAGPGRLRLELPSNDCEQARRHECCALPGG